MRQRNGEEAFILMMGIGVGYFNCVVLRFC